MKYLLSLVLLLCLLSHSVMAAPSYFNIGGTITRADGTAFEGSSVHFLIQVISPAATCVIYSEQINNYDMTGSAGDFQIRLGTVSATYPSGAMLSVVEPFSNSKTFNCEGGSTYSPVNGDGRRLRIQFFDGTSWKLVSQDLIVGSVPYATETASLNGYGASDFLVKKDINNSGAGSMSCNGGSFLTWDATVNKISCETPAAGTPSISEVKTTAPLVVTNGTTLPNISIPAAAAATDGFLKGSDWTSFTNKLDSTATLSGDVSGTVNANISVDKIKGTPLSFSTLIPGQFLKYSGSAWTNTTLSTSDISGISSYILHSEIPSNCGSNQTLIFSSPSGTFVCNSIAINGTQVSGNITGNAAGFTGNVSGDVSGPQGTLSVDRIKGVPVAATAPTSNQILAYVGGEWMPVTGLSGAGTAGKVAYYSSTNTLAVSNITYDGAKVGIGTAVPTSTLTVQGDIETKNSIKFADGSIQQKAAVQEMFVFTTSSTFTAPAGVNRVKITVIGGGGGGTGGVVLSSLAGGVGASVGSGSVMMIVGGQSGASGYTEGAYNLNGGAGANTFGGWGVGGVGGAYAARAGTNGIGYGSGGGGAVYSSIAGKGGNGGSGAVIIEY